MIDPQARPAAYIKLLALVSVVGRDLRPDLFHLYGPCESGHGPDLGASRSDAGDRSAALYRPGLHARRLVGRAAGEALRRPQRHLCRTDARIWQDRALRLSQRPRHRDHRLRVAHRRRQPRARSAAGGRLRRHGHAARRQAQARRAGNAHDGLFRRQRDARRLCHVAFRRGDPGPGIGAGQHQRQADLFLGALPQPAGLGCGHRGLRPPERVFLRDVVSVPGLYPPPGGFALRRAAGPDRWGGGPAVHAFAQTPATDSSSP